jgi:hypothetical protein
MEIINLGEMLSIKLERRLPLVGLEVLCIEFLHGKKGFTRLFDCKNKHILT